MKDKPRLIHIYSENNEYQHAEVLRRNRTKRIKHKKFFVEGVNSINLAIKNNWEIDTFLYTKDTSLSDWAQDILKNSNAEKHIEMPYHLMKKLSSKENTSELIALVKMKNFSLNDIQIKQDLFVVLLDRSSSPGNLGTIIRSCSSFGVDAIIMTGHSVDLYDPKTLQASVGSLFSIPIIKGGSNIEVMKWIHNVKSQQPKFAVYGTTVKTDNTIDQENFQAPIMLLIGNETLGLSTNYKEMCDTLVKIPIFGSASSLNVGCATSIFLYEINKKIGFKKNNF